LMKSLTWVIGLSLAWGGVAFVSPASATPPTGVDVATLSRNVVDDTEYVVTKITVAPGGGTGWHYHPGEVFGFISEGTMTHYDGGCTVDAVYDTGAPVKEGVGPGFVHNGRNEGSTPLVMEVVYINPVGAPKSVEVPGPAECPVS
ncbi:MAG: cupin domain-containing protein, partial [Mycobacteriaceae bacterium]